MEASALKIENGVALKSYSTFKIGGPATYFTTATNSHEMREAVLWGISKGVPIHVLGKGSNSLFDDRGFDGLVIYNKIDHLHIENNLVHVGSGYSFSLLGIKTAKLHLSGLEFASGIPGTVGGAIFMNAGANLQETATFLQTVTFIDQTGTIKIFEKDELLFSYRSSSFHQMTGAIIEATFLLSHDTEAAKKQRDLVDRRIKTQPYTLASCGCAFKNPEGDSAGRLIEQCGLKGFSIGDASVSDLHANFIVNLNSASHQDVIQLIDSIKREVKRQKGIELQTEIQLVPFKP